MAIGVSGSDVFLGPANDAVWALARTGQRFTTGYFDALDVGSAGVITFSGVAHTIEDNAGSFRYDVASGEQHVFRVNDAVQLSIDAGVINAPTDTFQEAGIDISPIGTQDFYIDAGAFKSKTTSGVASGQLDTRELPTNDNDIDYFEFTNGGGIQRIMGQLVIPRNFDNTNISVQIYWTTPNATTGDVAWKVQLLPRSDNDALDTALLAEVEITDTFLLANDLHVTTLTALTLSGAVDGDFYYVQIGRDPADAQDTLDGEAQFLGALFQVTTDTATAT